MKKLLTASIVIAVTVLYGCGTGHDGNESARRTELFNSGWKFALGDYPTAYGEDFDDSGWRALDLPHDWSIESDFSGDFAATPGGGALPGGIGWYRKEFTVPMDDAGKNIYVDFDGIYWNSSVWINGQLLGERPNGYISFRYDLTPHLKFGERNVIAVKADNSIQPNSRWYSGSGIYRNVRLVTSDPLHVAHWGTFVTTGNVSRESADVNIGIVVENTGGAERSAELITYVTDADNKTRAKTKSRISIPANGTIDTEHTMTVNNPELWSDVNPYIYNVTTQIVEDGKIVDEYHTPFGIRYFDFDSERGFILNGEQVKIKGVCMHHDLGCLGAAVNVRAMERQLEILKEMGCNGIRTAHNPPAPELLDLCDRMGFIVQDEAFDMWHKRKSPHDYSMYFADWHERDLKDLILRDRNHPSVFMWSIGNEILEQWTDMKVDTLDLQQANILFNFASSMNQDKVSDFLHVNSLLTIKLADIVKELDPTRPVTSGNNEARPGNHLFASGSMDILGINYNDNLWEELPQMYPGQNYIITESTSSLMSRGYYEMPSDHTIVRPDRWDVPYFKEGNQCSAYDNSRAPWGTTHEQTLELVRKNDFISGVYIWTGFDYLGEPTPYWWPSRSSYFGIIDLAGFPKDVYYLYQGEWTDKDVLHVFPHWNWSEGETVDIWAYYNNADEVELFLNGQSLGAKSKGNDEMHVWWRVPFEKGTLRAVSRKDGKEVLVREVRTTGAPVSLRLTADRKTIAADGLDLSFVTVEALDAEGHPVPVAHNLINFTIEGCGFIAGTDNGDPTDHNSLKKTSRNLFSGKALSVVRSDGGKGEIRLTANSPGLDQASVVIECK